MLAATVWAAVGSGEDRAGAGDRGKGQKRERVPGLLGERLASSEHDPDRVQERDAGQDEHGDVTRLTIQNPPVEMCGCEDAGNLHGLSLGGRGAWYRALSSVRSQRIDERAEGWPRPDTASALCPER